MSSPFTEFNPMAAAMSIVLLVSLSFLGILVLIDTTGSDTTPEMNVLVQKMPESSQDTNETGDESEELAEESEESEELADESEELADESEELADEEDTTDYTDMPGLIRLTSCSEYIPKFTCGEYNPQFMCDDCPDAPSVTEDLTDEEDRIIGKKVNRFLSNTISELVKIQQDRNKRNKTE